LQGWLVGPLQARRLLLPLLSPRAISDLLATLRAIDQVVCWNLAAIRGMAPLNLWFLSGLADEVSWEAFGREWERPASLEQTIERQAWGPDRDWVLKQNTWLQTTSVLSSLGVAFSQIPDGERVPGLSGSLPAVRWARGRPPVARTEGAGISIGRPGAEEKLRDTPQQERAEVGTRRDPGAEETARKTALGSQPPGAHPSAPRIDPTPTPLLVQSAARQGREALQSVAPAVKQTPAVAARADPGHPAWRLSSDLKLKEIIRTQVDVLLTSITMPLGLAPGQGGTIAQDSFAQPVFAPRGRPEAGRARTAEVRAGGPGEPDYGRAAPVHSKSEASFAPLADADVAPAASAFVPQSQEGRETPPAERTEPSALDLPGDASQGAFPLDESLYRGLAQGTATKRGTGRRMPPKQPIKGLTQASLAPRRLFSMQKRPDRKEAAAGPRPGEVVLPQVSHAAAGVEPSLSEVDKSLEPGRDPGWPAQASGQPTPEKAAPGYELRATADLAQPAMSVPGGRSITEITQQVEATLAQVGAGLALWRPEMDSAKLPANVTKTGETAQEEVASRPPATRTIGEIERQVAAIMEQVRLSGVSQTELPGVLPLPEKQKGKPTEAPKTASIEVLAQLVELAAELQCQVQQLADATDPSNSGIPLQAEGLDSDGDPQALSRELARQLVDEARRYGIRL